MFDSYTIGPRSLSASVSVIEKRAPTDESVRLLREMEGAAEKSVLSALRLEANTFKGVMQQGYDAMADEDLYRVAFELNGKRYQVILSRRRDEEINKFVERLRDAVAQELATAIIIPLAAAKKLA